MSTALSYINVSSTESDIPVENMKAFDYTCKHYLNMSGNEFLRRYEKGGFKPDKSNIPLARVLGMLPFVRPSE